MNTNKIPSLFSRLSEVNLAFEKVLSIAETHGVETLSDCTPHHTLVSKTLDVLEYAFLYGRNIDIEVFDKSHFTKIQWNHNQKYNVLARLISEDWRSLIGKNTDIDAIELLVTDGKCIGGISPLTWVYPSPNLDFLDLDCCFEGLNGNILFHQVLPLHYRAPQFMELIWNCVVHYNLPEVIRTYVTMCVNGTAETRRPNVADPSSKFRKLANIYGRDAGQSVAPIFYIDASNNSI